MLVAVSSLRQRHGAERIQSYKKVYGLLLLPFFLAVSSPKRDTAISFTPVYRK